MTIETKRKIVNLLEKLCCYFHQSNIFVWLELTLTHNFCNLAGLSDYLDSRWGTECWNRSTNYNNADLSSLKNKKFKG